MILNPVKNCKKCLKHLLLVTLLILTLTPLKTVSQEISTIGEIYDYEIGDIFHFQYYNVGYFLSITKIQIIDKYYSQNNDTLIYVRDINYKFVQDTSWQYSYYIDTVFYTCLDSLINNGNIDEVYSFSYYYNGRIVNEVEYTIPLEYHHFKKFVTGCGLAYHWWWDGPSNDYIDELVYYKKGDEEWGTPLWVSLEDQVNNNHSITIFPNPVENYLNISSEKKISKIQVYTINGKCIIDSEYTEKLIDLRYLTSGIIYIIAVKIDDQIIYKKFIKK